VRLSSSLAARNLVGNSDPWLSNSLIPFQKARELESRAVLEPGPQGVKKWG
jgi:hypothetical protein